MTGQDDPWTALVTPGREARAHLTGCQYRSLAQGLALITLDAADWRRIGAALAADPAAAGNLDRFMATVVRSAGLPDGYRAPVLFIAVDGDLESSVLYSGRQVVASFAQQAPGPDGPVNRALRRLGVDRGHHPDESAALGLSRS